MAYTEKIKVKGKNYTKLTMHFSKDKFYWNYHKDRFRKKGYKYFVIKSKPNSFDKRKKTYTLYGRKK